MEFIDKALNFKLSTITLSIVLALSTSCSQKIGEEDAGSGGGGGSGGTTNQDALASANTPLYFYVQTKPYGGDDEDRTHWGTCEIDPANLAASNVACTISIPEAIIRFSDTILSVGSNSSVLCPRIEFQPYYRQLTNVSFTPLLATAAVDCSATPTPVECFDGAARYIVPNFPNFTTLWFWTTSGVAQEWTVDAAFASSSYGNTRITNNLSPASRGANISIAGYPLLLANTFQDYVATCRDIFQGQLFRVTITIQDYDRDNIPNDPGFNDFYDWN